MTGANKYELDKRFAVVKRPDEKGDVIGKFDQRGGAIYIGKQSDTIGESIVVVESNDRSDIKIELDKREDWFVQS